MQYKSPMPAHRAETLRGLGSKHGHTVPSNRRHRLAQNAVVLNQHHRGFLTEATFFNHLNYRSVWTL